MKKNILLICFLFIAGLSEAQNTYHVIPYPNQLIEAEGHFEIKSSLTLSIPDLFKSEMEIMTSIFADEYKVDLLPADKGKLEVNQNTRLAEEEYTLAVSKEKMVVEAATATGCLWAFQTIRQLMTLTGDGSYILSACQIEDQPAYPWRGLLLDEARNFKGKEAVKVLIDQMSYMKMNVFHWHLTDDQGWRIEIIKYPLLTEIGAWRDSTNITSEETGWNSDEYDPHPHGGFYTQSEIKEIISYAAKRHITIVPEIDLPGHSMAAMASYPWLGVNEKSVRVRCSVGDITPGTLDIADKKVFRFIADVMDELMALFPGSVIHSGGDEADYGPWKESRAANKLMKAEGLKIHSDLQMYFSNRLAAYLENHGTRMMGWNEILGKNIHTSLWDEADATHTLGKNVIIQFWAGDPKQVNEALEKGYDVVNSHSSYSYLNYSYNSISLEKAYGFIPTPIDINPEVAHHLLGPEVAVWGERLFTMADLYRQVFPRLAASAEVGWTKEQEKDYDRFKESLNELKRAWEFKGILYYEDYLIQEKSSSRNSDLPPFHKAMYPPGYEFPPVRAITHGPEHHWFSYYDVNQFDPTGRYALGMQVDFEHRHPDPGDVIRLGIIDLENNDRWTEIGTTTAWCWQQGCRLQWRPGSESEVMWNALAPEGDHYITVIKDVRTGRTRTLPRPIYHVHPNGKEALGLDFRRLRWGDTGYGYHCLPDPNREVNAPENSGIYKINLETGESGMLFSIYDVARSQSPDKPHYFNAISWNTDGSRFSVIDRGWGPGRMISANPDGTDIRHLCNNPSHYSWHDPMQILIYTPSVQTGGAYEMFKDDGSGNSEVIWKYPNGHQTYFRDNEWILTDTYALDSDFKPFNINGGLQYLFLIHVPTDRVFPLGHFALSSEYSEVPGTSCDLHPRISPDGTKVIFDSPHGGNGRQMYLIDIAEIIEKNSIKEKTL